MSDTAPDTVAVPRSQFELMQRSTALLDQMLGDPTHAPIVEPVVKALNPHAVFPAAKNREALMAPVKGEIERIRAESKAELEAALARTAALETKLTERETREAAAAQAQSDAQMLAQLKAIQSKRGFSEEKMQEVLTRMKEQNNPDADAAAAWVAESIPKPLPAAGHDFLPSTVDVYGSSEDPATTAWKGLHENPTGWQTQELRNIVKDPEFLRLGQQ